MTLYQGGFLQHATGYRYGQCGCVDPYTCRKPQQLFAPGCNPGFQRKTPRFQTILNQSYAPFCNRFCTRTFEQDQWRDKLFTKVSKTNYDAWNPGRVEISNWNWYYLIPSHHDSRRRKQWMVGGSATSLSHGNVRTGPSRGTVTTPNSEKRRRLSSLLWWRMTWTLLSEDAAVDLQVSLPAFANSILSQIAKELERAQLVEIEPSLSLSRN